jgi:hypothetical protein
MAKKRSVPERSVPELVRDIQGDIPGVRKIAEDELFARYYRRCLACANGHLYAVAGTSVGASDVVLMAMKSILSGIRHGRITDPKGNWDGLFLAYVRMKARAVNRAAIGHGTVKSCDPDSLDRLSSPKSELSCEAVEQTFREIGDLLPKSDGTAQVFEQIILKGLDQNEAARVLGLSDRAIRGKMKTAINHLVDLMFGEIKMDPDIEEAARLVLDPRCRVDARPQQPGERLTELERCILAAADSKGVPPAEMDRRVQEALRILAGVLRDAVT